MPPKGGLRKRHLEQLEKEEATGAPPLVEDAEYVPGVGPRGGIRRPLREASASSASAPTSQPQVVPPLAKGGVAQRARKAGETLAPVGQTTFKKKTQT